MLLIVISILFILWFVVSLRQRRLRKLSALFSRAVSDGDMEERRGITLVVGYVPSVEYICSLLNSSINLYEVIVVDSFIGRERLLADVIHYFGLIRVNFVATGRVEQSSVEGLYRSHRHISSRLVLVRCSAEGGVAPAQIASTICSYDFVLELPRLARLRSDAIARLLVEIALREPEDIDQIKSRCGERFSLLRREIVASGGLAMHNIARANTVNIMYRILKM